MSFRSFSTAIPVRLLLVLALWLTLAGPSPALAAADPKAPDMTTVDAAFTYGKKNYFFYSAWYYRYRRGAKVPDPGYPVKISDAWKGMPKSFQEDIDAVFLWDKERVYFFKDDEYVRYNMKKGEADKGYPKKIKDHWPGLWEKDIDAAVVWPGNNKVYFFKDQEVKRYNFKKRETEYTKKVGTAAWKGVWEDGVDAALKWDSKKSYLFLGQQYVRFDNKAGAADKGYPRDIETAWRFSQGRVHKPVKRKKGPKCGERGKKACGFEKANFIAKARGKCPSGSFWDPIDGGSCYRCPSNYGRAIFHSVKSDKACWRPGREKRKRAKRKRDTSWAWNCEKNEFWDPYDGGACWKCPKGYGRTVYHVKSKKACAKWKKGKSKKAKYLGGLPCPKGSFLDIGGGECWSCPSGYDRTVIAAVNTPKACLARHPCESGTVPVGNLVTGMTCYKKGACGKKGQRPCLIVERVPSCNKGLAEDFIANKCIDDKLAACLTGVRSLRYTLIASEKRSKLEKEAMKLAKKALDDLAKAVPGLKDAMAAANKTKMKLMKDAEKLVLGNLDNAVAGADDTVKKVRATLADMEGSFRKNVKKFTALLTSDEFCTMKNRTRVKKLKEIVGADLSKVELADAGPGFWTRFAGSLLVKPAQAKSKDRDDYPSQVVLGLTIYTQRNHVRGGPSIAFGFNPDEKKDDPVILYIGGMIGPTTDSKPRKAAASPYIKLIPHIPYDLKDVTTVSLSGAANLFDPAKATKRGKMSMNVGVSALINWNDKKQPVSFGGVVIYPWLSQSKDKREHVVDGVKYTLDLTVQHMFKITELE